MSPAKKTKLAMKYFACPKCGHKQSCPCSTCQDRTPTKKPWIWVNGSLIQCAKCGHTASEDWWAEQEFDQRDKDRESSNA